MRFIQKIGFVLVTILSIVGLVSAQDECPASVNEAILALNDICLSVGRNQVCYGNGDIVAIPQSDATIDFAVPSDTAFVDDIESMTLSPFEVGIEEWGVAVLVLQADLPDTLPGQNVTMLLFGNVSIANDSGAYYFTAGIGTTSCNQAPNGILIQTPEGAGEVNLVMNGINISLGSTAYLTTSEDNVLTFALLEGNSTLTIDDSEVELETEQFTTVELDEDGNAIIEINPDRFARAGVKFYKNNWDSTIEQLQKITKVSPIENGYLLSDQSGVWIYLMKSNSTVKFDLSAVENSTLGNFAGLSLETTDIQKSIAIWEILGFSKTMGSIEQGWVAYENQDKMGVSFMQPNSCPHLFFNPSLTYFNGKDNLSIIEKIRTAGISITEEITHFNKEGIVDNIIIRDPGGYGFFIFSD